MFFQFNMQTEGHPQEQTYSCYIYNLPKERSFGYQLHCHSYNEIMFAINQPAHISINGVRVQLNEGELVFIPPLVSHEIFNVGNAGVTMIIQFSNSFLYGWNVNLKGISLLSYAENFQKDATKFVLNVMKEETIHSLFQELTVLCKHFPDMTLPPEQQNEVCGLCSEGELTDTKANTLYYWKMKGILFNILSQMLSISYLKIQENHELLCQDLQQIQPLIRKMILEPENNITMQQASKITNMSYYHFSRTFQKIFNTSFVDYKNQLRVRYAEQLLLETNKSITEIAQMTNFGNITYFNRIFKKYNHLSPSEYRKQAK